MLAKQIELAPKNGDFVVLQDGWSGSWEVGRWAPESGSWVRIDGKPLRIFPTHWVPVSGDTVGSESTEGLSFLAPAIQMTESPKRLGNRFILAFTVRNSDDCDHPFRRIATSAARVQTTPLDDGGCDASRLVVGQAQ